MKDVSCSDCNVYWLSVCNYEILNHLNLDELRFFPSWLAINLCWNCQLFLFVRCVYVCTAVRSNRFYGFRQQDSHELLRHLLDGIREEERHVSWWQWITLQHVCLSVCLFCLYVYLHVCMLCTETLFLLILLI